MTWAMFCVFPAREAVVTPAGAVAVKATPERIVMGHQTYDTREEAEEGCAKVRRQNLPFKGYPVQVIDPREPNVVCVPASANGYKSEHRDTIATLAKHHGEYDADGVTEAERKYNNPQQLADLIESRKLTAHAQSVVDGGD